MRLKTIRLHPFGHFRDESRDISTPLALIAGPNEIGKTTLRQAIFHAFFTSTQLTPAKLHDTMAGWFPLPGGDHAAITLTFEHDGKEWMLEKRWGVGKAAHLSAVGVAPLADSQVIAAKLAQMLGHSEATYRHILFTGHTELEQTIASLRSNADQLRDVRDLLRAGGTGAGDVDEQRLRNALTERIKQWFGRWDDERGRPERQNGQEKGVNDPWTRGVGEILKAWYAWQQVIVERDEILKIEKEIDHRTGELAQLDENDRNDLDLIADYGVLRSQLSNRLLLEERVPRFEREQNDLQHVFTEWPKAAAALEAWENMRPKWEEQSKRLNTERDTARRREGAVAIAKNYELLLKAKQEFDAADAAVQQSSYPDAAIVTEIKELSKAIDSAENKLTARTLAWRVEAAEPKTICVTSGFEPAQQIEVGDDGAKGTAAGRVQFELGGLKLTVDGGDDDVDTTLNSLKKNRERLAGLLAACGAETVEAALELSSAHTERVNSADSKRRVFESMLQGKSFEQWKQEADDVNSLPQTRDLQSIDEEIRINQNQIEGGKIRATEHNRRLEEWKSKYVDLDSLGEQLFGKKSDFRKAKAELDAAPTVPSGFSTAKHLIEALDAAQQRLNANRQPREEISIVRTRLEIELGDRRSEDLAEKAEVAERVFQRTLVIGQSYKRILESLNRVTAGGDDVLIDFAARVERIFSQVTRGEAKLEFDGSLPVHVHRDAVKLELTRLSQGTSGALALAVRLAMAEAYLGDSGGFIMLDDPLVHFDNYRAAEAVKIIRAFAERHQVIFFTCHDHHAAQFKA